MGKSEMGEVCADAGGAVCLMHMRGDPRTMQSEPRYRDVVDEVADFLTEAIARAEQAGVDPDRIWIDPGIGFGKDLRHNLELLNRLEEIVAIGYPVMVGVSRKSFIGNLLGSEADPALVGERLEGSLAAQVLAVASMKIAPRSRICGANANARMGCGQPRWFFVGRSLTLF